MAGRVANSHSRLFAFTRGSVVRDMDVVMALQPTYKLNSEKNTGKPVAHTLEPVPGNVAVPRGAGSRTVEQRMRHGSGGSRLEIANSHSRFRRPPRTKEFRTRNFA